MKSKVHPLVILLAWLAGIHQAHTQGTEFTYQGQLQDRGTNANGTYTMIFALYDSVSGGTQIGSNITDSPTLTNGLFSVNLDFGTGAFNGNARWLDITITNPGTSQELSPRAQVLPVPYAQFAAVAATVTNGAIMNAQLAPGAVNTANIQNSTITVNQIASGQVVKSLNGLMDNVILSAGNNVTLFANSNSVQFSAGVPNLQVFTNSGTFVVPTNVTRVMVEAWGAGGGGGAGSTYYFGGGGGGGGYGKGTFAVIPSLNYIITVGQGGNNATAGGDTSFAPSGSGPLIIATGGGAGSAAPSNAPGTPGTSGNSNAPFSVSGGYAGGNGGAGGGGGGGGGVTSLYYPSQWVGQAPGGGGAGGITSTAGSQGAPGRVVIYY